jgi:hypothetical protein
MKARYWAEITGNSVDGYKAQLWHQSTQYAHEIENVGSVWCRDLPQVRHAARQALINKRVEQELREATAVHETVQLD